MDSRKTSKFIFISLVTLSLLVAFGFLIQPQAATKANQPLSLQAPPFLETVRESQAPGQVLPANRTAAPLPNEIGISAWITTGTTIDLNDIRSLLVTNETPLTVTDYVVGSITPAGYGEGHEVHVYAHISGWVIVYYLDAIPTAFIFDSVNYSQGLNSVPTKLELVLNEIATKVSALNDEITYYHFSYPNATRMMLIAEDGRDHYFIINLPSSYQFFEKSWRGIDTCLQLDGVNKGCGFTTGTTGRFGAEFDTDVDHTIRMANYSGSEGMIALIYREQ